MNKKPKKIEWRQVGKKTYGWTVDDGTTSPYSTSEEIQVFDCVKSHKPVDVDVYVRTIPALLKRDAELVTDDLCYRLKADRKEGGISLQNEDGKRLCQLAAEYWKAVGEEELEGFYFKISEATRSRVSAGLHRAHKIFTGIGLLVGVFLPEIHNAHLQEVEDRFARREKERVKLALG